MSLFKEMITMANDDLPLMQEITKNFGILNSIHTKQIFAITDDVVTGETTDLSDDFEPLQKAVIRICEIAESLGLESPFDGDINDEEELRSFSHELNMQIFREAIADTSFDSDDQ